MTEERFYSRYDGEATDRLLDIVNEHKDSIAQRTSEIPVLTVMRTVEDVGNIFGEGWVPCDGRSIDTRLYPGIDVRPTEVRTLNNPLADASVESIESAARKGDTVVCASFNSSDTHVCVYVSTDGGMTFRQAETISGNVDVAVFYLHDRFFVMAGSEVRYSFDGMNWARGVNEHVDGIHFPYNLYAVFSNGLYLITDKDSGSNFYSTDGVSWHGSEGAGDCGYLLTDGTTAVTGNQGNSGPYYNDGSDGDWKEPTGIPVDRLYNYHVAYTNGVWWLCNLSGGSVDGCYTSQDGIHWEAIETPFPTNGNTSWTYINNGSVILVSDSTNKKTYRSTDGGNTFEEYTSGQFPSMVINELFVYFEDTDWYQSADGISWTHHDITSIDGCKREGDLFIDRTGDKLYLVKAGLQVPDLKDHYVKLKD